MGGKAASQGQKPSERKETSSNKGQRDGQKQSADKRTNITPGQ